MQQLFDLYNAAIACNRANLDRDPAVYARDLLNYSQKLRRAQRISMNAAASAYMRNQQLGVVRIEVVNQDACHPWGVPVGARSVSYRAAENHAQVKAQLFRELRKYIAEKG